MDSEPNLNLYQTWRCNDELTTVYHAMAMKKSDALHDLLAYLSRSFLDHFCEATGAECAEDVVHEDEVCTVWAVNHKRVEE